MEIYFVRHGETRGNRAQRHQADDTQLSKRGKVQVADIAPDIAALKPTHLLCSPLVRTVESATIIGEACGLVPERNEVFAELYRPCHLYGHYHRSLVSLWFYVRWYLGVEPKTDEGESYKAVRARVQRAKAVLATYPADARVVVVSHSVFINLFLAHVCRERALTPFAAAKAFWGILTMPNTDIQLVTFDPEEPAGNCAWYREQHG